MHYYGVIEEIWEVSYTKFFVPVFKYRWLDNKVGHKIDKSWMTLVDFWKIGYQYKPFIMTYQASRVFYVKNLMSENWYVMLHGRNNKTTMKMNNPIMIVRRLSHLQEWWLTRIMRMLWMLYMQLKRIMTNEYIYICVCVCVCVRVCAHACVWVCVFMYE